MLTSFGVFWGEEGVHAHWPGGEVALLVIIPAFALFAIGTVWSLRRHLDEPAAKTEVTVNA